MHHVTAFARRVTALMANGEAGLAALVSAGVNPDAKVTVETELKEGGDIEIEMP